MYAYKLCDSTALQFNVIWLYSMLLYCKVYVCSGLRPRARIFKRLWSPGIDFKEWIPPVYSSLAGRYDNPIPTRFLAPIYCLKIPVLGSHDTFTSAFRSAALISFKFDHFNGNPFNKKRLYKIWYILWQRNVGERRGGGHCRQLGQQRDGERLEKWHGKDVELPGLWLKVQR